MIELIYGIGVKPGIKTDMTKTPKHMPKGPSKHGPGDPLRPTGDLEVLTHPSSGVHVIRQEYSDGYIYEYMMPKGLELDPREQHTIPFATAKILRTYEEGDFTFIAVWVPNREAGVYEKAYQKAVGLPDFEYDAGPTGDLEVLHEDAHVRVARERYSSGWVYLVELQLGFPWPSFFLVPSLTPTRTAPIVSIESSGTAFLSKFWVSNSSQYAPVER
ncbi:hypothetical protein [Nonomuraea sp. NPDC049129]|uniref:hypothetical protein n=1 Tax=Nonomuraea sp. NPDC049129 TaxID=3155272 RepID=UPI0033DC1CE1